MTKIYCKCCKLEVELNEWDFLYGSCHECAFCASLSHFPCCHGACVKHIAAPPMKSGPLSTRDELVEAWKRLLESARGVLACV